MKKRPSQIPRYNIAVKNFLCILVVISDFCMIVFFKKNQNELNLTYRVSHSETSYSKWLWGVEGSIIFLESWCLVASGGLGIWLSSTSFQKSNIGWPQQPPLHPTERVSDISKKSNFWWLIFVVSWRCSVSALLAVTV